MHREYDLQDDAMALPYPKSTINGNSSEKPELLIP